MLIPKAQLKCSTISMSQGIILKLLRKIAGIDVCKDKWLMSDQVICIMSNMIRFDESEFNPTMLNKTLGRSKLRSIIDLHANVNNTSIF